jgi:ubiquinone/menaquinone biosynthesis C-methylase UbiE
MADKPMRLATPGLDQEHRTWYDPEDILDAINVKAASTCVELGCGEGAFTYPLARRVGKDGRVYAVDTSLAALDQLKIKKPGVNIVTLRADLSETRLPAAVCDLVLATFALSTVPDAGAVLAEAARLLKADGRLAVIDWRPVPPPPGPPIDSRIRTDRMQRLLENHGFIGARRLREGSVYYTLLAQKGKPIPAAAPRPQPKQAPSRPKRR